MSSGLLLQGTLFTNFKLTVVTGDDILARGHGKVYMRLCDGRRNSEWRHLTLPCNGTGLFEDDYVADFGSNGRLRVRQAIAL